MLLTGCRKYLSKFAQGDVHLISLHAPQLSTIQFTQSVSVGPGPLKWLKKMLQSPDSPTEPEIKSEYELPLLKWLSNLVVHAIEQKLENDLHNRLGQLIGTAFSFRFSRLGDIEFPLLHDTQVRGCVAHMATRKIFQVNILSMSERRLITKYHHCAALIAVRP